MKPNRVSCHSSTVLYSLPCVKQGLMSCRDVRLTKFLESYSRHDRSRRRHWLRRVGDPKGTKRRVERRAYAADRRFDAVLNMLTPKRAGPMSPGEIANGPQDKEGHAAGKGSLSPNRTFENGDGSKEFLSTGRTGRRNALPDILGRHAETDISDLPDRFEELTMETDRTSSGTEHDPNQPSTSKQHAG